MNGNWLMKLVSPFGYRHPQVIAGARIVAGVWLLTLTAVLFAYGRGSWWAVVLLAGAAVSFYLAYRLPRLISARKSSAGAA